jgi:hypothetical protein
MVNVAIQGKKSSEITDSYQACEVVFYLHDGMKIVH